jgi:PAS domain
MKKDSTSKALNLRQKAEELLIKKPLITDSLPSEIVILRLNHELQVYQIELEMQNEELRVANDKAEFAVKKYTKLYDFAPTGYFILSKEGKVIDLNLSGTNILGKKLSGLKNSSFDFFVSSDTKPIFNTFLSKVFNSKAEESCEIILSTYGNLPMYVSLNGIVTENSEQCFVNVMNITDGKRAAELIIANKELVFQNKEKEKRAAEYKDIYDNAKEGMFRTSLEGKIIQFNKALAKMMGYGSAENFVYSVTDSRHQVWVNADERLKYAEILEKQKIIRG